MKEKLEFLKLKKFVNICFKKDPSISEIKNKVLVFNMDSEKIRFIDKTDRIISGDTIIYSNERINNIITNYNNVEMCK